MADGTGSRARCGAGGRWRPALPPGSGTSATSPLGCPRASATSIYPMRMTRIAGHGGTHWAVVMIAAVLVAGGCSTAKPSSRPSESVAASASAATPPPVEPSPTAAMPRVSEDALLYFFQLATTPRTPTPVVVRWSEPVVTVHIDGTVSSASQKCLRNVVSDFNALTATTDLYLIRYYSADITVQFAPVARFPSLHPDYIPGSDGFSHISWNEGYSITNAHVLIRTTGISDAVRCHHIREELTRSTGLMGESDRYRDSVFNFRYSNTRYSELDKQVISLLYSDAIGAGYPIAQVGSAYRRFR